MREGSNKNLLHDFPQSVLENAKPSGSFYPIVVTVTAATIRPKQILDRIPKADKSEKLFVPQGTTPLKVLIYKQSDMEILFSSSYQYTRTHQLFFLEGMSTFFMLYYCIHGKNRKLQTGCTIRCYMLGMINNKISVGSDASLIGSLEPTRPLTAGHIQYALEGQVQQVFLNKACSLHQWVPISSLLVFHKVTVQISLETRPLGKSQPCRCAFSTTEGRRGITLCSFVFDFRATGVFSDIKFHAACEAHIPSSISQDKRDHTAIGSQQNCAKIFQHAGISSPAGEKSQEESGE